MQRAKKTPSGKYRVRIQKIENGKKIDKSFTAPTKREAEEKALKWMNEQPSAEVFTIKQAIGLYLESRKAILSPATYRGYISMSRALEPLYEVDSHVISSNEIQSFISSLVTAGYKPKSVKNIYGFLASVLNSVHPERHYAITLPKKVRRESTVPSEEDVRKLLRNAPSKLRLAILLGICTMRRGEICALKYGDVDRRSKTIHVHADLVYSIDNEWVYKDKPKTTESNRLVLVPWDAIQLIELNGDPDEYIFAGMSPQMLTKRFNQLKDEVGVTCRFHDLRGFGATFMHFLNIPEQYILTQGGWTNNGVMQTVYRTSLEEKREEFAKISNDYIVKKLLG